MLNGCADDGEAANSGSDPAAGRTAESGQVENRGGDPVVAIEVAGSCGMMGGSGDCIMVSGNGNSGDCVVVSGVGDPEVARLMVSSGSDHGEGSGIGKGTIRGDWMGSMGKVGCEAIKL